jgi:hypothetical protein
VKAVTLSPTASSVPVGSGLIFGSSVAVPVEDLGVLQCERMHTLVQFPTVYFSKIPDIRSQPEAFVVR